MGLRDPAGIGGNMCYAKMVEGTLLKRMGTYSIVHYGLEADAEEGAFNIQCFDGNTFCIKISDVIDVIFQAYRKAAEE